MTINADKLYTIQQVRDIEKSAIENFHFSEAQLMHNAALAAFQLFKQQFPLAKQLLVIAGPGNNGGDGCVFAELANQAGFTVSLRLLADVMTTTVAQAALKRCQLARLDIRSFSPTEAIEADVMIDALCGIGVVTPLREAYLSVIRWINQSHRPVFSLDLPSGIHADQGIVLGDAIKATKTITFIGQKIGLVTGSALDYCGEVFVHDLKIPEIAFEKIPANYFLLNKNLLKTIKSRKKSVSKADYGHVLVVGGNHGMPGAVMMAAVAAYRVGAGLVSIATRSWHAVAIATAEPALMAIGVETTADLSNLLKRVNVIAVGPGLGQDDWARMLFEFCLAQSQIKIIDADALNLLGENPQQRFDWILTPHPGEAARLLHISVDEVQANRYAAVKNLQKKYGGVVILKGAGSLIAIGDQIFVCTQGNPGMATGGVGDVLTGTIAGFLAQGHDLENAAKLAVLVHAMAGDIATKKIGEAGLMATDLLLALAKVIADR